MSETLLTWRQEVHGPLKEAVTRARDEGQLNDNLGRIIYAVLVFVHDHNLDPHPESIIEYIRRDFGVATSVFDMRPLQWRWVPWVVEALNTDTNDLRPAIDAVGQRMNDDYWQENRRYYRVMGVL